MGFPRHCTRTERVVYVTDRPATEAEPLAGETPFRVITGQVPVTAFGKSCQKLEIGIIRAYSPQAKGRGVKELKLNGIRDIDAANEELALPVRMRGVGALGISQAPTSDCLLRAGFEADLNRKFRVVPAEEKDEAPAAAERDAPIGPRLKS